MVHPYARLLTLAILGCTSAVLAVASCSSDDSSPGTAPADASLSDVGASDGATSDASTADGGGRVDGAPDGGDGASDARVGDASSVAVQIAVSSESVCVVMGDKSVRCWGDNSVGQCGQPLPDGGGNGANVLTPTTVSGLGPVRSLTMGLEHTCALLEDSTVRCWGNNLHAQLGMTASATSSATPVLIAVTGTPIEISAGFYHTCIRRNDGTAQCWGGNDKDQIGNVTEAGSLGANVATPTDALLTNIAQLDVGGRFACGRLQDAGVSCWGDNGFSQLGRGSSNPSSDPRGALISGLGANVVRVGRATGYSQAVQLADTTVLVWGLNQSDQLGRDDAGIAIGTPTPVPGLGSVNEIALGTLTACAIKTDRTVQCWGNTTNGAVGVDPDSGPLHAAPSPITGVTDAVKLAVAGLFGCAIRGDGNVACWGDNIAGQLGRGVPRATLAYDLNAAPVQF